MKHSNVNTMLYIKMPYVYCKCCKSYIKCEIPLEGEFNKGVVSCGCDRIKLDPSTTPYSIIGNPDDYQDHSGVFYDALATEDRLIENYGIYESYARIHNEMYRLKSKYPCELEKIFYEDQRSGQITPEYIKISDGYFSTVKERYTIMRIVAESIKRILIDNAMNQHGWHFSYIPGLENEWKKEEKFFESDNKGFLVTYSHTQHYSTPENRVGAAECMAQDNYLCVFVDNDTEDDEENKYYSMDVYEETYPSKRQVGGIYKLFGKDTEKDIQEDVAIRMVANIYMNEGLPLFFEYNAGEQLLTVSYLKKA